MVPTWSCVSWLAADVPEEVGVLVAVGVLVVVGAVQGRPLHAPEPHAHAVEVGELRSELCQFIWIMGASAYNASTGTVAVLVVVNAVSDARATALVWVWTVGQVPSPATKLLPFEGSQVAVVTTVDVAISMQVCPAWAVTKFVQE